MVNDENVKILKSDDPSCLEMELSGYKLVGRSWGAHLEIEDNFNFANFNQRIEFANSQGYRIEMLGAGFADQMYNLEVLNNPHYPYTPATHQAMPTPNTIKALWAPNSWNFGAIWNSDLVGVCATSKKQGKVELDFGSVHPDHRGKGVGVGIAAYAIKNLAIMGENNFATGGAELNSASKATVEALGFRIDEIWHSYVLQD